jgi:hypothetical protein
MHNHGNADLSLICLDRCVRTASILTAVPPVQYAESFQSIAFLFDLRKGWQSTSKISFSTLRVLLGTLQTRYRSRRDNTTHERIIVRMHLVLAAVHMKIVNPSLCSYLTGKHLWSNRHTKCTERIYHERCNGEGIETSDCTICGYDTYRIVFLVERAHSCVRVCKRQGCSDRIESNLIASKMT